MKNVQIVFNIQVPDHVSEQEVNARLNQILGSLMAQEFNLDSEEKDTSLLGIDDQSGHIGHA